MRLHEVLASQTFAPVIKEITPENNCNINLSPSQKRLLNLSDITTEALWNVVFPLIEENNCTYGWGGYMENRNLYQRSSHFGAGESRSVHLGIDIWSKKLIDIYAPVDGVVHSCGNNEGYGNYGGTIILEHKVENIRFFTLYGHMSIKAVLHNTPGKPISAGDKIGRLGDIHENGDWPPHLHFQIIMDMEGYSGDYPGVCYLHEKEKYERNCPDPNLILKFD